MTTPLRRARTLAALTLCIGLFAPMSARGQSADPETARALALYEEATAELDAKKYESACPKLEEVTRALPDKMGAKLTLAECYEGQGKLASAWSQYTLVQAMAAKAGQAERSKAAGQSAATLAPRLAMLTIEVPAEVRSIPGLAITRGGLAVSEAQWGAALPVDAGGHDVVATAPGRKAWKGRADIAGEGAKITLTVKAPEAEPIAQATIKATPKADAGPERPWQRPLGFIVMGLGGAGVVIGSVLGGLAISTKGESNADNHCDAADMCDAMGLDLRKEAVGLGNGSTASIIAGAALLTGGVVLIATAPRTSKQEQTGPRPAEKKPAGPVENPNRSILVELATGFVWVKGTW